MSTAPTSKAERPPLPIPKRRTIPWWVYLLLSLAILFFGIVGPYTVWYLSAESQWRQAMDRARALGEPIWLSDLAPPPIPPEDDAAPRLAAIEGRLWGASLRMDEFERIDQKLRELMWRRGIEAVREPTIWAALERDVARLRAWLADNSDVPGELAEALSRSGYYPMVGMGATRQDVSLGPPNSHRNIFYFLQIRRIVALADGELDLVIECLRQQMRLAELSQSHRGYEMYASRRETISLAAYDIELLASLCELSDDQRRQLDAAFAACDGTFPMEPCAIWSRCETMDALRRRDMLNVSPFYRLPVLRPLWLEEQAYALDLGRNIIPHLDRDGPDAVASDQQLDALDAAIPNRYIGLRYVHLFTSVRTTHTRQHRQKWWSARLGLRVDAWRRAHGTWPPSLADVCDEALPEVPGDLITGAQPILRTGPTYFMIYSVGTNGRDDGGLAGDDEEEKSTTFYVEYGDFLPMGDAVAPAADPLAP